MKSFSTACRICLQNIRKWGSNKRIWMIMIMSVVFVYTFTNGLATVSGSLNEKISPWVFPFLWSYRYMKMLFLVPILFIFCDAPFIDSNQVYVMIRTKRLIWSVGQVLYIFLGSLGYILILMASIFFSLFTHMQWMNQWGNVLGVSATTNILIDLKLDYSTIKVPGRVIHFFKPIQAMFYSILLVWLSAVFLGLLIYVINAWTNTRLVGTAVAGFFVILPAVVDGHPRWMWFSPMNWNSLGHIDIGGTTAYPTIDYVLGMYLLFLVVLISTALLISKKQVVEPQEEI